MGLYVIVDERAEPNAQKNKKMDQTDDDISQGWKFLVILSGGIFLAHLRVNVIRSI